MKESLNKQNYGQMFNAFIRGKNKNYSMSDKLLGNKLNDFQNLGHHQSSMTNTQDEYCYNNHSSNKENINLNANHNNNNINFLKKNPNTKEDHFSNQPQSPQPQKPNHIPLKRKFSSNQSSNHKNREQQSSYNNSNINSNIKTTTNQEEINIPDFSMDSGAFPMQ